MDIGKDFGMTAKWIGVILVMVGCGGAGFQIAANYRQEEKSLRQLVDILDYMECELNYRLTPLPELFRKVAKAYKNIPGNVFDNLALEIDRQTAPDIAQCYQIVLNNAKYIPPITQKELELMGNNLGKFDLEGQLKGLDTVREDCKRNLTLLSNNRDNRLRSYQTLGLCAGAALAILFV